MSDPAEPPLLHPPRPQWPAWLVALLIGGAGWILVMKLGHRREAWDSPYYFQLAYPLFGLTTLALGYFRPGRPWRWPLGIAVGQALIAFIHNPTANLLPLGLIAFGVMSVPLILPALLGRRIRRWRDTRQP